MQQHPRGRQPGAVVVMPTVWGLEHPRHKRHKLSYQMMYSLEFLGIQSDGNDLSINGKIWMLIENLIGRHRLDGRSLRSSLHRGWNKRCLLVTYTLRHSPISWSCPLAAAPAQHLGTKINVSCLGLGDHTPQSVIQMLDICGRYTDPYDIP